MIYLFIYYNFFFFFLEKQNIKYLELKFKEKGVKRLWPNYSICMYLMCQIVYILILCLFSNDPNLLIIILTH